MLTKIIILIFGVLLFSFINSNHAFGQNATSVISNFKLSDTAQINHIIGDARVIGIGESAHGSGSMIQLRGEIIKDLILHHGVKNIVLESMFWGTRDLNKYIKNEYISDTFQAFVSMGVGPWINAEMLGLLTWVREYNANKVDSQKVSLYGCDVWDLKKISMHFRNHPWVLANLSNEAIGTLDSIANIPRWRNSSKGKKAARMLYKELIEKCKSNSFATVEENYFTQLVGHAISNINVTGGYRSAVLRDERMANTIIYLTEQKPDGKFVVIAHNEHVNKARNSMFIKPMGRYLYKKFGEKYRSIAITFINGNIQTYNKETRKIETVKVKTPIVKSVESRLEVFLLDTGIIDLLTNKHHPIFKRKIKMRSIGGSYSERHINYTRQKLYNGFNFLIILKESKAPQFIHQTK